MSLQDELEKLVVEVTSPDGNIKARLVSDKLETLAMRPGTYDRYDERTLEHQLSRLATLAWTGYRRGFFKAKAIANDIPEPEAEYQHLNPERAEDRRYYADMAEIVAEGTSPGKVVRARSQGLLHWKVQIRDGALEQVDEATFLSECRATIERLRADSRRQEILLKDKYFGLNVPMKLRAPADPRRTAPVPAPR